MSTTQREKYVPPHLRNKQGGAQAKVESDPSPRFAGSWGNPPAREGRRTGWDDEPRAPKSSTRQGRFADAFGRKDRYRSTEPDPILEKKLFGSKEEEAEFMTSGINFDKYDNISVELSGNNIPEGVNSFSELDLEERLKLNVGLAGYSKPTPIQKNGIPIALAKRDLMACAQTGSGKTAAFLLPTLCGILKNGASSESNQLERRHRKSAPSALILAPTRELATQIFEETRKFSYCTGLRPVVIYGGVPIMTQFRELERGCDILVATPGRLSDMMERGKMTLSNIRFLIFDEADRMLDMGFEPQIRRIVEDMDMPVQGRQTLMFSATFPKEIQQLASDFLHDYIFLTIGRVGSTSDFIIQKIEYAEEFEKKNRLMNLLPECEGLTVIFVETKRGADSLEVFLIDNGVNAISIHGDRTQDEREYALKQFKCGNCPVLVATDVAARGLDIPNVMHVINYDLPNNIDDYVHRIGRTGRCGNNGTAYSMINERNKGVIRDLFDLLKESKQEVPVWFEEMIYATSRYGGGRGARGRRGGYGGSNQGSKFASRDFRKFPSRSEEDSGSRAPAASSRAPARSQKTGGDWDAYFHGTSSKMGGSYHQSPSRDAW